MPESSERTLASVDTEGRVKETFPIDMSPEEFAALYSYRDRKLDEWIQDVNEILQSPDKMRECQAKYLTPAEKRLIDKYMQEDDESLED
jgi:hypothetical protein